MRHIDFIKAAYTPLDAKQLQAKILAQIQTQVATLPRHHDPAYQAVALQQASQEMARRLTVLIDARCVWVDTDDKLKELLRKTMALFALRCEFPPSKLVRPFYGRAFVCWLDDKRSVALVVTARGLLLPQYVAQADDWAEGENPQKSFAENAAALLGPKQFDGGAAKLAARARCGQPIR